MRTITFKTYTFDELTPEAREKAIENVRDGVADINQCFVNDELCEGLKYLESAMSIKLRDAEIDAWSYRFNFVMKDEWKDLEDDPRFLCRYLDRLADNTWEGKYYSKRQKSRTSKVLFSHWQFSGMWYNEAFSREMNWRFEYVRDGFSIREFVDSVLTEFFIAGQRELEYCYTDEAITDTILANNYEFLENGTMYTHF